MLPTFHNCLELKAGRTVTSGEVSLSLLLLPCYLRGNVSVAKLHRYFGESICLFEIKCKDWFLDKDIIDSTVLFK